MEQHAEHEIAGLVAARQCPTLGSPVQEGSREVKLGQRSSSTLEGQLQADIEAELKTYSLEFLHALRKVAGIGTNSLEFLRWIHQGTVVCGLCREWRDCHVSANTLSQDKAQRQGAAITPEMLQSKINASAQIDLWKRQGQTHQE
eukprot:5916130-Amphidinium_carterae.4